MVDFSDSYDKLTDTDALMGVLLIFAGFMLAEVVRVALENREIVDLPNYVYGAPVAVGGYAVGQDKVAMGGAANSVFLAADEFGVRASVNGIAAGSQGGN